ncbi:nucleotide-sugar transporter family protein [Striga asiatica]|uniref:Nucleotide-sugar transporter family protein n=1 Tax=Striga asiatica TaxID=4170 RepID=A0A5A7QVT8_STRAF|nr:nucleotide-sugar transporter family protein [Striga asiatica]
MDSNPTGAVASTSDVHELPMEMNEMKIREDKTDDHEDTTKIFRALNYMLRVIGIFHRDTKLWNLLVWLLFYFDELSFHFLCCICHLDMVASNLAPISVNFLTQAAKVIFAIVMLIFQARRRKVGEKALLSFPTFIQLRHCLHLYFYVSVIEEMSDSGQILQPKGPDIAQALNLCPWVTLSVVARRLQVQFVIF